MFYDISERVEEGRKEQRREKRRTGPVSAVHTGQGGDGPLTFIRSKIRLHVKKNELPNSKGGPKETGSIDMDKEEWETHCGSRLPSKEPGSPRIHSKDTFF